MRVRRTRAGRRAVVTSRHGPRFCQELVRLVATCFGVGEECGEGGPAVGRSADQN